MSDITIAALQTFRAVARCGSFTAAAADLRCSQSAISRNIALLEHATKQTLVLRGHRRIQLTPAGEIYLQSAQHALEELERGAARMTNMTQGSRTVRVLAMPSFASRWLIPRLARLHLSGIDADIELSTSIWDTEFRKERFDIGIHYGDGSLPGSQLLLHDSLVPVISSHLVRDRPIKSLEDLQRFPWLHDTLRGSKWQQWLVASNATHLTNSRSMKLQDAETTLTAAVQGLGIAIGHDALVAHDLDGGRLVEAWPHRVPLAAAYHLILPQRGRGNPMAATLVEWLVQEAKAFRGNG